MNEREDIIRILKGLSSDITKIKELEKYDRQEIIDIAIDEKIYSALMIMFKPITIDGQTKIYIDPFSTQLLTRLQCACTTEEEAKKAAQEAYERNKKLNELFAEIEEEEKSDEEEEKSDNELTFEEALSNITIIPKQIKEDIEKSLFTIDMDLLDKIKIKDSYPRQISGIGHPIYSIEDVIFYSEPACLKPSIDLFNKNIITTMNDTDCDIGSSSENGYCFITCDYGFLSQENKDIFDELIKSGVARRFMDGEIDNVAIFVPCSKEETVGDISNKLQTIVSKLKKQDYLYGSQTLENFYENNFIALGQRYPEIYNKYFNKDDYTWDDVIMFAQDIGYFYDPNEDMLWSDKRYYDRHYDYVQSLSKVKEETSSSKEVVPKQN